ncbi:AMP-dependent synthetase/ligase [Phytophthora cactorum]|nr:AMP-dependent synthetase/ligase [Phytophthora cactorum]
MGSAQSTSGSLADMDFESYTGKRYTVEVPNTRDATHGPAYEVPDKEPVNEDEMTLYHNFLIGCGIEDGNRPCYGQRTIDPATGKAGAYEWLTYNQVKTRMDDVASGMVATFGLKQQDKVGIFCKNQVEWCLANHAIEDFILRLEAVRCHHELHRQMSSVKTIVMVDPITDEQKRLAAANEIELKTFEEIEEKGKQEPHPADPPLRPMSLRSATLPDNLPVGSSHFLLATGTRAGACSASVNVPERCVCGFLPGRSASPDGRHQQLQPTVFVTVPRLVNRVYDKITQGAEAAGGIKKMIFDKAIASKLAGVEEGGNVRLIFSGSAPMSADVKKFMQAVFCCEVVEGYGLSESAAAVCVGAIDMPTESQWALRSCTAKSSSKMCPKWATRATTNLVHEVKFSSRGPRCSRNITKTEMTREAIDERGWFHTGDIGCWNADGTLSIIDRKKNIFKLAQGEYVAAEKIENAYSTCKFVAQIFVAKVWAQEHGLSGEDATKDKILQNEEFRKDVREDMERVAAEAKLRGFERVKNVHFHPKQFTSDDVWSRQRSS